MDSRSSLLGTLDDPHVKPLGKTCVVSAGRPGVFEATAAVASAAYFHEAAGKVLCTVGRPRARDSLPPSASVRPSVRPSEALLLMRNVMSNDNSLPLNE